MEKFSNDHVRLDSNEKLGRFIIATGPIKTGELILEENSICSFPWSRDKSKLLCLRCCKVMNATPNFCELCQWPVCDSVCRKTNEHARNECKILANSNIKFASVKKEFAYNCIETLRCLLLQERNPSGFKETLQLEAHISNRDNNPKTAAQLAYVIDFIRDKCGLENFGEGVIKQVLGASEISTFQFGEPENRYCCALFTAAAMLSHDCSPNCSKEVLENSNEGNFTIRISARKDIQEGEILNISYGDMTKGVEERRSVLKDEYFFDCGCKRCTEELNNN